MQANELKRRFGRKVQELREARGLTQEHLAARIGRSVDTVSNIERGMNATRIEIAYLLAAELHVRLSDLFDIEGASKSAEPIQHPALQEVVRLLETRDPETIKVIKNLVEVGLRLADSPLKAPSS
ncbi:helix-turn-helix domain-containing protein [Aurantimonas sp. DM33-3]|uniref:helix-turn-helix transcriptional regulator n=1 Tax=Aurantimonas sp. DM33-3 TaxID=2766955 RepID=UPI001652083F|nr:helix-turn-helix domain-containing protein [Aurantimonas sp. DM33-3]MBC6718667.1 helix-turn-helix domain-containing protein [Aurantimonas sp. DM33-3]